MRSVQAVARRFVVALVTASLAFTSVAIAEVRVDETTLQEGENAVGGGTATLWDSILDMLGVTANTLSTDEDLTVNFNGGNDIDTFKITDDANVVANYEGENEVEDIEAYDQSSVTVNMNEHNEFEDIEGNDQASITANVSGNVACEAIKGYDDATVTVRGTTGPCKDVLEVGEGKSSERIGTERGDLTVEDVSVVLRSEQGAVSSTSGNVTIKHTKISGGEGNERTDLRAGGTMLVEDSAVDITGTASADGELTIQNSEVDVRKAEGDDGYRVWSRTGINLVDEKNGEVEEGEVDGKRVWYVDTGDGEEVHLDASSPLRCDSDSSNSNDSDDVSDERDTTPAEHGRAVLPATGDASGAFFAMLALVGGVALSLAGVRRRLRG